ncbi:FtsX-like permease family protein [Tenacibaculum sp. SG-28]|uniref:ABC transporter permease n=1 Tax=Tenacibaculum sp. SG-28 TaxID=754426 RepID=UPI000CF37C39|nr:FtsX-like permease family protein [Tenacibaculum sp. SG-28]PQJ23407.1 transmembrane permease [Tenacibaculum sp. SG-28]
MNFEWFIAKRIIAGKEYKNSISSPIIKIATIAISLGIVVMLISVAIGTGFQQKIRDKITGFKGHVQIVNYDNNNTDISTVPISKKQPFYPEFSTISDIRNVQVYANKFGVIRTETDFEGIVFKGVSEDYDFSFFNEYLIAGRLPNYTLDRNKEILISKTIADRLQLKLQDTIQIVFSVTNRKIPFAQRKPIVVGVYDTGFQQFDKTMVIGDIREVQRLNKWKEDQVGGFEVLLNDFTHLEDKGTEIYNAIGATLNSTTIAENYPQIFNWLGILENNVWVIIGIMILVAGINMITALLVLILEQVQTVGVLKALGSTNWSIRKIFIYNASFLILKGMFFGNIIGLMLLFIQKYFKLLQLNPENYYVDVVPISIDIFSILLLNLGTLFLCFLMLIVPSYIITKIEPSKSIKFA